MPIRTIFFGTPTFALPILNSLFKLPEIELNLIVTQPDTLVGRKQVLTPPPVKVWALEHSIPIFQPPTLKTDEAFEFIRSTQVELIVLAAYGKIIPASILDLPKFKAVNIHPSALPKYRGATPIQTTLLNGESVTATTLMLMEPSLDTGPILAQQPYSIAKAETYPQLDAKLAQLSADLLTQILPLWLAGTITPQEQNHALATHTKVLTKTDGHIDWQKEAFAIECQTRAFTPWPGTYTLLHDKRLKILKAQVAPALKSAPGTMIFQDKKILVSCGNNSCLEILELQEEGKNPIDAQSFIAGHPNFDRAKLA